MRSWGGRATATSETRRLGQMRRSGAAGGRRRPTRPDDARERELAVREGAGMAERAAKRGWRARPSGCELRFGNSISFW